MFKYRPVCLWAVAGLSSRHHCASQLSGAEHVVVVVAIVVVVVAIVVVGVVVAGLKEVESDSSCDVLEQVELQVGAAATSPLDTEGRHG